MLKGTHRGLLAGPIAALVASAVPVLCAATGQRGAWVDHVLRAAAKEKRDKYAWAGPVAPASQARKPTAVSADPSAWRMEGGLIYRLPPGTLDPETEALKSHFRRVGQGVALTKQGKLKEARSVLEPIVRERGAEVLAVNALADVALHEERYAEALALMWATLHKRASEETLLRSALAAAMTQNGTPEMKAFCDQYNVAWSGVTDAPGNVKTRSDKASSLIAFATMHLMHGSDEIARIFYERASRIEPNVPWMNFTLGRIYGRMNDWHKAVDAHELALQHAQGRLRDSVEAALYVARYRRDNSAKK